ncbi:MAG TPA: hypothetical protein VF066_03535 [Thermoleophilaceae bacterium]
MNRITLTVVAVLLAVPALAQAKAGIEFDNAIETQKPGDRQSFTAIVMNEPTDPMGGEPKPVVGVRPLVTFRNERTGKLMHVRTDPTNAEGLAPGSVTFPDRGPWTATLSVGGRPFEAHGEPFQLAPPATGPAATASQPAAHDGGGFPTWLLSFPAAGLAALGIWRLRRRLRWGAV